MKTRRSTRFKILRTAERLFQLRGYHGFSYKDISVPLGIKNAAIHYHFPSKEDLGIALIKRYRRLLDRLASRFYEHETDPREALEVYFRFHSRWTQSEELGCPIAVVSSNYSIIPEGMKAEARALIDETLGWLNDVLIRGRESGQFSFPGTAKERGIAVQASLQGAAELARIGGPHLLEVAIESLRQDFQLKPQLTTVTG